VLLRAKEETLRLGQIIARGHAVEGVLFCAHLAMKEKALAKVTPIGTRFQRFRASDRLLAFLESL
jgi:hypothetical protein